MFDRAVINAGPHIALSLAERLDLLPTLFTEFWIPEAVHREAAVAGLGRPGAAEEIQVPGLIFPIACNPI